jgi:hypothetical protein
MDEYDGVGFCGCEDFQFRHQPLLERGAHKVPAMKNRKDLFRCRHLKMVVKEMAKLDNRITARHQNGQPT